MYIDEFYRRDGELFEISAAQGSHFAKSVADDFNPLHDVDNKRFCVPGDLLFALVLHRYGVSQSMAFRFSGMVSAGTRLLFPEQSDDHFAICDEREKQYLDVTRSGDTLHDQDAIGTLVRHYVRFSGHNFPHVLVPLMAEQNVMINPQRPLVIYEGMQFVLDKLTFSEAELKLTEASLQVDGKRGDVKLAFDILDGAHVIGKGKKTLVMSGLREFDAQQMEEVVEDYAGRKAKYC